MLHHLVVTDQLAGSHRHGLVERHAGWEVTVLRVWGCFFEGSEMIFALVVFFFAAVVAIWAFGAVASIVSSAMSTIELSVMIPKSSPLLCLVLGVLGV